MVFRTDAIVLGVLLAWWSSYPSYRLVGTWLTRLPRGPQVALTAALLLALMARQHSTASFDVGLMAVFSTALVFLAAQDTGLILRNGK